MKDDIRNTIVLITGANRGIGKALVEAFIAQGAAKVYAAVRNLETAQPLVTRLGQRVVPLRLDLADATSILAAAKTARDAQVVVNNAGVLTNTAPLADNAISAFEYEMNINVYGLIRMAQAFAPVLKANGGGVFVQLNSVASLQAFGDFATYCASKAAAYSITQSLRQTLAAQGTRVISVHPGPIATDMGHAAGMDDIAEPPAVVADALLEALRSGAFHAFAGTMARQVGTAYRSFAEEVVESD